VNWNNAGSFSHAIDVTSVGTFAGNSGNNPAFTAQVDYFFNTAAPIDPEDGNLVEVTNEAPIASDDSASLEPAETIDIAVLDNDSDSDGTLDPATLTIVNAPTSGTVSVDANGLVNYTHDGSATSTDSFTYTVNDNEGATSNEATVNLSIVPNQVPTATDDSASLGTAESVDIAVLGNDSDSDGTLDPATLNVVNAPANGTLSIDTNGLVTYTHDGSTTTADSFTYTVADDDGAISNEATVNLDIADLVASFESDDFSNTTLDPRWTILDPLNDGAYGVILPGTGEGYLELSVPEGTTHDLWKTSKQSLRAMQVAQDSDFELEVKYHSQPTQGNQTQGILVEQDEDDWIRFDTYHDGSRLNIFAATTSGGSSTVQIKDSIDSEAGAYLRVSRQGDTWTFDHSVDGSNWLSAGSFNYALNVTSVGPFASNSGSNPAFASQVDYFFNGAAPIVPEDGGLSGIVLTELDENLEISEIDGGYSYGVTLAKQPSADVTVNLLVDDQVSADRTSLTFTPDDWDVAQAVNVTAINDTISEGSHASFIGHESQSTDASYDGLSVSQSAVTIIDDDLPIRINPGGETYTDRFGKTWSADHSFNGGLRHEAPQSSIDLGVTDDPGLYRHERAQVAFSYEVAIANGTYDVNLSFIENAFDYVGGRVFDVAAEGQVVLDDVDLFSEIGRDVLVTKTLENVEVADGVLNLDFSASASKAPIMAIEVLAAGSGRDNLVSGGSGNNSVYGVDPARTNPGQGEVDELTGLGGADTFMLADTTQTYYDDEIIGSAGTEDYALIKDFNDADSDVIQLRGSADNYILGASPDGLPSGIAIFEKHLEANELIAIVEGGSGLDLYSSQFSFV
jgi:regulation of enolase protein 1 (concanavalin A-like superfamily)